MKEIMELRKQISECEYKIKSLEESLTNDLNTLKENAESWHKMGILSDEDKEFIMNLSVDDAKEGKQLEFIEMYNRIGAIVDGLEQSITSLQEQISKIENM